MANKSFLTWPFFTDRHRALAEELERWCEKNLPADHGDVDAACRDLVQRLGRGGWLSHSAPDPEAPAPLDVRTLCLIRETLARHDGLADFAFAMQGLGAGPISLFGNAKQRDWLKRTRAGDAIAAFALTEPQSGSDVANIALTAQEGEAWGFFNRLVAAEALEREALALAQRIASGPTFANGITKTQLVAEWSMSLDQAIEAEAQAQAVCMQTKDFERAYRAFVAKQKPVFEGN